MPIKRSPNGTSLKIRYESAVNSNESLQRLERVMADQTPKKPISEHPFSSEDRKRGEALLKRCQLRSPR